MSALFGAILSQGTFLTQPDAFLQNLRGEFLRVKADDVSSPCRHVGLTRTVIDRSATLFKTELHTSSPPVHDQQPVQVGGLLC